jgi:catechol 2,3-dioxygenase-like lactoylglutathione lyase family enzyme
VKVTRRSFLGSLSAAAALGPSLMAQSKASPVRTRFLNNVMITVSDMGKSVAFYEKLFGPSTRQGELALFRLARSPRFFTLGPAAGGAKPAIVSYGLAVEDFDAERLAATLKGLGVTAQVTPRDGTPELWVADPDGSRIQLQDPAYAHGSGVKGDVVKAAPGAAARPALALQSISHVTLTIKNGARCKVFYQTVLGMPVQAMQGQTACLAVGPGPDFVAFNLDANNPNATAGPNHVAFGINGFDPNKVMGILADHGLEPVEYGTPAASKALTCRTRLRQRPNNGGGPTHPLGSYELYFSDPDNIMVQIQDVSYCGGSGANGQICP